MWVLFQLFKLYLVIKILTPILCKMRGNLNFGEKQKSKKSLQVDFFLLLNEVFCIWFFEDHSCLLQEDQMFHWFEPISKVDWLEKWQKLVRLFKIIIPMSIGPM